jgi:hypothetical protein
MQNETAERNEAMAMGRWLECLTSWAVSTRAGVRGAVDALKVIDSVNYLWLLDVDATRLGGDRGVRVGRGWGDDGIGRGEGRRQSRGRERGVFLVVDDGRSVGEVAVKKGTRFLFGNCLCRSGHHATLRLLRARSNLGDFFGPISGRRNSERLSLAAGHQISCHVE